MQNYAYLADGTVLAKEVIFSFKPYRDVVISTAKIEYYTKKIIFLILIELWNKMIDLQSIALTFNEAYIAASYKARTIVFKSSFAVLDLAQIV